MRHHLNIGVTPHMVLFYGSSQWLVSSFSASFFIPLVAENKYF
jgi:hypothetical protein